MHRLSKICLQLLLIGLFSCQNDTEKGPAVSFEHYVAVGNSLTAGVSNNGLYNESINNAYPNLIAKQMQAVGGGSFEQALFNNDQQNGTGYLKLLGYNGLIPNISTVTDRTALRSTNPPLLTKYSGPNQNLGIPFIKIADIDNSDVLSANVFFERLTPAGFSHYTYLQMVEAAKPTFFSLWLGNNDLLTYANSGGTRSITPVATFEANLRKLLDLLTRNGAKGVVANLSDIAAAPTISLITNYRPFFSQSKFYIETANGQVREGTSQDLLLPTSGVNSLNINSLANKGTTMAEPWRNREVLDADERATLLAATKQYNAILKAEAAARNLAHLDTYAFMEKLKNNFVENGDEVNTAYLTGGFFSLDGAHLTPKGNAFTANQFIRAINSHYHSNIPTLDTKLYQGVTVSQ
jgi:hypothetical protein